MNGRRWLPDYWGRNPWWIPPHMLGRVPREVGRTELKVLGFVTFALLFEHYDTSLLGNALKFTEPGDSIEVIGRALDEKRQNNRRKNDDRACNADD